MKNVYKSVFLALLLVGSNAIFAQVPLYSSSPAAPAVLFLDFDGQTISGTSWNVSGPIAAASSGLNTDQIAEVYNRIAEDYRPFNINVTTDSTKYTAAAANRRMRVMFTTTYSWYGSNAGGVAYTGSFTWGDNTPCWIFTSLLNYNTKNISEAGAHEAGHTLGLRHQAVWTADCATMTSAYSYGTGSGEIGWAPIMGVGYSKNFTTWHNGPNPYSCTTPQNDLSIITSSTNGVTFKTDDYADTFTGANVVSFSNNQFTKTGTITTDTDKDMFTFNLSAAQKFTLSAIPANVGTGNAGSNLDLQVQLYDGAKTLLKTYNQADVLSIAIDTNLNMGTYYLLIDGVGNLYSNGYGSLGSYSLLASIAATATTSTDTTTTPADTTTTTPTTPTDTTTTTTTTTTPTTSTDTTTTTVVLKGKGGRGTHKLSMKIVADQIVTGKIMEVSFNGKDFKTLATLDKSVDTYNNTLLSPGVFFYRMNLTLKNNKHVYSNIVAMGSEGSAGRPKLISTLISGNEVKVTSPDSYDYVINDFNGRIVAKGQITSGNSTINTNYLSSGTYVIRFVKGSDQFVEKFMKQ